MVSFFFFELLKDIPKEEKALMGECISQECYFLTFLRFSIVALVMYTV